MADQKISELTELTSAIAVTDLLAVVDSSESETKKITLANLPLTIAQFASSVPYTVDIQNGVEQTRNLTTITDSDGYAFTSQPSSIYIGTNVTSIGSDAFYGSIVTSLTIPSSVTSIGQGAFYLCSSLSSLISLAVEAPTLGTNVFTSTNNLTQIIVPIGSTPSYVAKGGGNNQYGGLNIVEA